MEALKLYGRAWRQIAEHVGTKTAVQIRSHAQKFFSKLEREGSSGVSKGTVTEIDIPPPRPKRKPTHPYPRKGVTFSSHNAIVELRPGPVSGTKSAGCEASLEIGNDVALEQTKEASASDNPEITSSHSINSSPEKASPSRFSQKPRKRGTEEVQCDAFPNEIQLVQKLSRSACNASELTSSPMQVSAHELDMPSEIYGSKLLATFHQTVLPYHNLMHHIASLQNATALLNSAARNRSQPGNLDDTSALASLAEAHAGLSSSFMPWLTHNTTYNPIAFVAAPAAAAWPGLASQPPHLPQRPHSTLDEGLNPLKSTSAAAAAAAAMAAAAAASFADASTWLALHGAITHPPVVPEVRSLFRPNPLVHSAIIEGRQQQGLSDLSEGSKRGDNACEPASSDEHEASTVDGMPESYAHLDNPNSQDCTMADDNSRLSADHAESNSLKYKQESLNDEERPSHNSSTDSSSNGSKGRKKHGFNGSTGTIVCVESKNDLQNSAYLSATGKKVEKQGTVLNSDERDSSPNMYQSSNSPEGSTSPRVSEPCGDVYVLEGRLDALTTSVQVMDSFTQEQSVSSVGMTNDHMDKEGIMYHSKKEIQVERNVSMHHENDSPHMSHGGEVSIPPSQRQCISSCGSTENQKAEAHDSPVTSSKTKHTVTHEYAPKEHTEDSGSEVIPLNKAQKVLVQACSKRWQGDGRMPTHPHSNSKSNVPATPGNGGRSCSTCREAIEEKDPHQEEETRSSLAVGLIKGSKKSPPLIKPQSLHRLKASTSGSSKYSGHGFVPYRRS